MILAEQRRKENNPGQYAARLSNWKENRRVYRKEHPEERRAAEKTWRQRNPQRCFDKELKRRYGKTIEWFWEKLIEQSGRCAVCSKPLYEPKVDHNHETGESRGLLCHLCNVALGFIEGFKFSDEAMKYLRKHGKQ